MQSLSKRHHLRWLCGAILCAFLLPGSAEAAPEPLVNLDFEQGEPGEVPPGWLVPEGLEEHGYTARTVEEQPQGGKRCALITLEGTPQDPTAFGNLTRTFDAAPYRGKRVRLRAAVRAEVTAGHQAQLWLRVDRPDRRPGFFDNMRDRPITSAEWARYEIVGDVADDAVDINLGLILLRDGKAWLDSVSFEVLGEAGLGNEPARPLAGRAVENLVAFTRLLNHVRFFHPSDQAAAADWEELAAAGIRTLEPAASAEELAAGLKAFFHPIAPTVQVFPAGREPALPAAISPAAGRTSGKIVGWRHYGVGLGIERSIYRSERIDNQQDPTASAGRLSHFLSADAYRGQRLRLRAWVRTELVGDGKAELWLQAFPEGVSVEELEYAPGRSIAADAWQAFELETEVGDDAVAVGLGITLHPPGRVWIDAVALAVVDGETETPIALDNPDLEVGEAGEEPPSWRAGDTARGYRGTVSEERPKSGRRSGLLAWEDPGVELPDPAEPYAADLGGGVVARIPLALYADPQGTLPHLPAELRSPAPERPEGFIPAGGDRTTRLAAVVLAWGIFQHFYPYFDVVETDWPEALRRALRAAAVDPDERAFLDTLRRLVAELHDGHGRVRHASESRPLHLPLLWHWIEDQLVVTRVAPEGAAGLRPGDAVLTIDGKPALSALVEREALISGATLQWRRTRSLYELAMGEPGQEMRLEVAAFAEGAAFAGEKRTVTLRATLPAYGEGILEEERPEKIAEVRPGIFYLDLGRITDEDFRGVLGQLAQAQGIVFDLRGYPRLSPVAIAHLIDEPVSSARWNVPVLTRPDREGMTFDFSNWWVMPEAPRFTAKVAFLTDGRAISYAETYLGIIEHYRLAEIVGSATAGTNGNVNPFTLPGDYRVSWTGMQVLKHDGSRHHGVGIQPTIPVARTRRGVAEGRDEVLERALEVVSPP